MAQFTDQLGRTIEIPSPPERIVSLVPSISEMLWDFGLQKELAGITKFCIHPDEMYKSVPRIGGTKKINRTQIATLQPDFIIGNKEENTAEDIDWLSQRFPVWMSDVNTLKDALEMIETTGKITHRQEVADKMVMEIQEAFTSLRNISEPGITCVYLIWNNPIMAAGKQTFIDAMLQSAGFINLVTDNRYPEISPETLVKLHPQVLILSTEPYPFGPDHIEDFTKKFPGIKICSGDGEMFSWYGSRLRIAPGYFRNLHHHCRMSA